MVACASGGIPEAVFDNENGLLVPKKTPEKLAEAILKLLESEKLRDQFGQRARQTVQKFDIKNTVAKNIELYRKLLDERRI